VECEIVRLVWVYSKYALVIVMGANPVNMNPTTFRRKVRENNEGFRFCIRKKEFIGLPSYTNQYLVLGNGTLSTYCAKTLEFITTLCYSTP
jgi:hypothetical protein